MAILGIKHLVGGLCCVLALSGGTETELENEPVNTSIQGKTSRVPPPHLTAAKQFSRPSGGSSLESLQKIREMMNVRNQNLKNDPNSRVSGALKGGGGGFPFTSYGMAASNRYPFGPMQSQRPFIRQHGSYGSGGVQPSYGGGVGGGGFDPGSLSFGHGSSGSGQHGSGSGSGQYVGSSGGAGPYGASSGSGHGGSGSAAAHLSLTDYKHIWVQMLQEIYKIIKDKSLLKDSSFGTKVLDHLFYLLQDIRILHSHQSTDVSCPEIYHKSGDLCLCVDFIDSFLDYYEARLYCQMVKGGDLVMFRDANEYHDIIKFVNNIDVKNEHSYWLGLSDAAKEGDWRFIDGRNAHFFSPFWGVRQAQKALPSRDDHENNHVTRRSGKTKRPTRRQPRILDPNRLREIAPFGDGNYAFLNKDDFYYIWDGDDAIAEEHSVLPLCQYIPERDQQNFQYGEGIWESWNEYNEWAGWNDNEKAHGKQPPHSHGSSGGPFGYGFGSYMGGHHAPWRRSNNPRANAPHNQISGRTHEAPNASKNKQ